MSFVCVCVLVCAHAQAYATTHEQVDKVVFEDGAPGFDEKLDQVVACQLAAYLQQRLAGYK